MNAHERSQLGSPGGATPRSRTAVLALLGALLVTLVVGARALADDESAEPNPSDVARAEVSAEELVRGMTISCQTWGWEWGSEGFRDELVDLASLGTNWVAIHPYARILADGTVRWRAFDPDDPPEWLTGPLRDARAEGLRLFVKPHLAYWGSPFSWRGEIEFADAEDRARFWSSYTEWIVAVARACAGADAFAVGTELDRLLDQEAEWREVITAVRAVTDTKLTYAANWSDFERVPFWDALDAVGVQAYFPLLPIGDGGTTAEGSPETVAGLPDEDVLRTGWSSVLERLRAVHGRTGKPVVFTELGYDVSLVAALEPWKDGRVASELRAVGEAYQERCYRVAFEVLERERAWLRGAFLWKWFVGEPGRGDGSFYVDRQPLRALLQRHWAAEED